MSGDRLFGLTPRAYLAGWWRVDRTILDRRAGASGRFDGKARFERAGETALDYREEGEMRMGGASFRASRSYRWEFDEDDARVLFPDGRPFHRLPPEGDTALHDCPPDTYRVTYRFETADRWCQRWIVTGPRKDHTLESVFTRLHPPGDPVHLAPQ